MEKLDEAVLSVLKTIPETAHNLIKREQLNRPYLCTKTGLSSADVLQSLQRLSQAGKIQFTETLNEEFVEICE